jgi:N utilization substance protein B
MTAQENKKQNRGSAIARNSAARLLAVQAVYQMHKNEQDAKTVIREFLDHRAGVDVEGDGEVMVSPNQEHFSDLVQGVEEHINQLGEMVSHNRGEKKSGQKTEPLLNAIFLCGAYELMMMPKIDAPVIISDYLHVTHAFYDENEAKLVNAVLDSLKKTVRD